MLNCKLTYQQRHYKKATGQFTCPQQKWRSRRWIVRMRGGAHGGRGRRRGGGRPEGGCGQRRRGPNLSVEIQATLVNHGSTLTEAGKRVLPLKQEFRQLTRAKMKNNFSLLSTVRSVQCSLPYILFCTHSLHCMYEKIPCALSSDSLHVFQLVSIGLRVENVKEEWAPYSQRAILNMILANNTPQRSSNKHPQWPHSFH